MMGILLVLMGALFVISLALLITGVAAFVSTPHKQLPPAPTHYPTADEIVKMNKEFAAKRAKVTAEVAEYRGRLLAFQRKPWYKSSLNPRGKK